MDDKLLSGEKQLEYVNEKIFIRYNVCSFFFLLSQSSF